MPQKTKRGTRPGSVRIIAGEWRRRRLPLPKHARVRPTPDRVRETLFNWLQPDIVGASCLDLFAGSGALGLEALSRGARHAILVERDPGLAAALVGHVEALAARADVVCADVHVFLKTVGPARFDVIFVDPPYDQPIGPLLEAVTPILTPRGLVYVERAASDGLPDLDGLRFRHTGRAGAVCFGVAERTEASV